MSDNTEVVLEQLATRIRAAHEAGRNTCATALHYFLDAGSALNEAHSRVSTGGWSRWLRENCFLSRRTAYLYQQLDHHRDEIEAYIAESGKPLSLNDALRRIKKPRTDKQGTASTTGITNTDMAVVDAASKPTIDEIVAEWSDLDWQAAFDNLSYERFLVVMPETWRSRLQERAGGQALRKLQSQHPNTRVKNLKRQQLSVVVENSPEKPTTH